MGRYVKELKNGNLKIDKAKVRNEEKLDGKYLLSTSDESLSAEEIALGYKQLYEVDSLKKHQKEIKCSNQTVSVNLLMYNENDWN